MKKKLSDFINFSSGEKSGDVKKEGLDLIVFYLKEPYSPFIIFIILSLIINAYFPIGPLPSFISIYGGISVLGMGGLTLYWTLKYLRENEQEWDPMKIEAQDLVVLGPYHYSRNPVFVSLLMVYIALFIFLNNMWGIILLFPMIKVLSKFVIIPREERFLEEYGETYQDYHDKTARWL